MRASQRYAIVSPWYEQHRITTGPANTSENFSVTVVHETADIEDTQQPYEYRNGAHRVSAKYGLSGKTYQGTRKGLSGRTKTFYGEMAWMDAERLFNDLVADIRYGRR